MAFSALKQCRSAMHGPLHIRTLASSTTPKLAASITHEVHQQAARKGFIRHTVESPALPIIGVLTAFLGAAGSIGLYTLGLNIFHSPSVQVTKTRRECMPEVDLPDAVIKSADNFQNGSFLRKVAHIQDKEYTNYTQVNPYSRSRKCETLKSVGVPTQED